MIRIHRWFQIAICGLFILILPGISFAQSGCRLEFHELKPILHRFNPFFTDHSWDDEEKKESARLDEERLLVIRQKACRRHHILLSLHLEPSALEDDERFWITETLVLFKRVFFENTEYLVFKQDFEKEFIRAFLASEEGETFNFPVAERTFICNISKGDWGGKIKMEIVKLVFEKEVRYEGIPKEEDDGWFKAQP